MKTKYKYIHFNITDQSKTTKRYLVKAINTKHNYPLGLIGWHPKWRCYIFAPERHTIFSQDCLADIIDFIKQLKK